MVYCGHCAKNVTGERLDDGYLCCRHCGRVLEDQYFSQEPTFVKNSAGQSKLSGNYVRTIQSEFSASRQRTLDRAYDEIKYLSLNLGVNDENMANQALAFYKIALERNFTRGRKSEQVQAACLYIAFRQNNKPYLLIDFSNYLRTNVYVLGAVFLQLCKVLRLEEHPIVQQPVDPSLFIYKFTNNLLKQRNVVVSETALNIVANMKRDWMQTGRKPSGLCGAALYISALAYGFKCSKTDIISYTLVDGLFLHSVTDLNFKDLRIVHVCEATLTKRLVEFENTESSSLTIEELNMMANEREKNSMVMPKGELKESTSKDPLCEHKNSGVPHFALGLCEACYKDFNKLSGGLGGGLDPPAFQRAERERMKKKLSEECADESYDLVKASNGACRSQKEDLHSTVPERDKVQQETTKDGEYDESRREDDNSGKSNDELESFSDIDDQEVEGYLHNEEEKHYKKIIWEKLNREYLEEQAAKKAAAAAAKKAFEANFENCSKDVLAARELAASVAADLAKSRKEMKRRRAHGAKNSGPAQSAAEATCQMLKTKRLSSKVNYDRLAKLFDEPVDADNPKKVRFDLPSDNHDNFESKVEDKLGSAGEFEDEADVGEACENTLYTENVDDTYSHEDVGYNYDDDDNY